MSKEEAPVSYELADYEAESSDEMVVTPHFGTPAFVEPGSTFEVELTSKEYKNLSKDGWIISLENDYSIWFCEVTEATDYTENGVYLGMKDGYKLIVKVPENVPCELLNLSVRHRDSLKERRAPQSVSVIENIDENFYAVGISDTHLTKWNSATTAIQEGSNLELFNKQMQLAGARYLYHGGDMTTVTGSTDRKQETMDLMVDAFTDTKVPLIAVAGNHEYDCASTNYTGDEFTFDEFDRIFGRRSALIEMGNNMIIAEARYRRLCMPYGRA